MCQKGLLITPALSHIQQRAGFQEQGRDDITFCCTQVFLRAGGDLAGEQQPGRLFHPSQPGTAALPLLGCWSGHPGVGSPLVTPIPWGQAPFFSPSQFLSNAAEEEGLDKRVWGEVVAGLPSSSSQDDIMPAVVSELLVCCWAAAWREANPHLAKAWLEIQE